MQPTVPDLRGRIINGIEWGAALGILVLLVVLHVVVLFHAGPLWRDEITSLNVVSQPSWAAMFKSNACDSFPSLWHIFLRAWIGLGLGGTLLLLRLSGLLVGLGIVAALWWAARTFNVRVPLLALVLFALNSSVLVYGDAVRAYGFATLLMLLTLGAVWRMVQKPTPLRTVTAAVLAILSVHANYPNSVLLATMFVGVVAAGLYCRTWRPALYLLVIGLLAALSMLLYLPTFASIREWNMIVKNPMSVADLFGRFSQALIPKDGLGLVLWALLVLVALGLCLHRLRRPLPNSSVHDRALPVFILTLIIAASLAFLLYLKYLSVTTQPWYYLPIIGLLAVLIDAAVCLPAQTNLLLRAARLFLVLVLGGLSLLPVWRSVHLRATTMDLLAAELHARADKDDFIVVMPFYLATSFAHYYHGPASWMTVPPLETDFRIQPYRLYKDKMTQSDPLRPLLQKIYATLESGHKVWLVGDCQFVRPGEVPGYLPPAPSEQAGWQEVPYSFVWSRQTCFAVQNHARTIRLFTAKPDGPVRIDYEDVSVFFMAEP